MENLTVLQSIIIAIVEGLTEFLPVSSTGHMIITQQLLGVTNTDFLKAFTVIIQFGAILSVVVLYHQRFFTLKKPVQGQAVRKEGIYTLLSPTRFPGKLIYQYDFYWKLFIALIPAGILGVLFSDAIDNLLERVEVVAAMLVLGGIFMLFCDRIFANRRQDPRMTDKKAFIIGLYQCIAMIPGVSRSMATIVGGMAQRLNRKEAAEFSFFLAVPTMFAAAVYKLYKLFSLGGTDILAEHMGTLLLANAVAFVVAIFTIKFFIGFVTKHGFKLFGWYRIIVGGVILTLMLCGHSLQMA